MIWTPLAAVVIALSAVGTGLVLLKLRRDWDVRVSSVRWLFFMLFVYMCALAVLRLVYYLWVWVAFTATSNALDLQVDDDVENRPLSKDQLDRLGIHAILHLRIARNGWMAAVVSLGDVAVLGVTLWLYPLAYELSQIATNSMDRGVAKEQSRIRAYKLVVHILLGIAAVIFAVLTIASNGYTKCVHDCLLAIYVAQIVLVGYMGFVLLSLKIQGHKYERARSLEVASPVYIRLKQIMMVYLLFSMQFLIASLLLYTLPDDQRRTLEYIFGASFVLSSATGLALSIVTGCSQSCVLRMCRPCLPDDFEAQLMALNPQAMPPSTDEPPQQHPVFVYTDIESSSALWAIDDGRIMQRAIDQHDLILRSLLTKHHGYEITTSGDSFQLAFHSIREAVEYCLEVQLQLLVVNWPKELHGMVPATCRQHRRRYSTRLVFNGLRVRMGIHDAADSDGTLVCDVHAVTGKMTYVGASEVITREVGDMGAGGQILITSRVAQWLIRNEALMAQEFAIDRLCNYQSATLGTRLELYELFPIQLRARKALIVRPPGNLYRPASQLLNLQPSVTDQEPSRSNSTNSALLV